MHTSPRLIHLMVHKKLVVTIPALADRAKNIKNATGHRGMKTIKFRANLVKEIVEGRKTVTWRLFDDKDLVAGDQIELLDWETNKKFAEANITNVREKKLCEITETDFEGHETYKNHDEMLQSYKNYYGDRVNLDTSVKIVAFEILNFTL